MTSGLLPAAVIAILLNALMPQDEEERLANHLRGGPDVKAMGSDLSMRPLRAMAGSRYTEFYRADSWESASAHYARRRSETLLNINLCTH